MKIFSFPKILLPTVLLILVSLAFVIPPKSSLTDGSTLSLQAPAFVFEAQAANSPVGTKLDNEAGISAYYKAPSPITLSQVRGQFRTIETETADYIIGSVEVPNYLEHFDAHAYVHRDGWILAYYLKADPVSKIVDLKALTIDTTKLKTVVAALASAAGVPFNDVTYYDFRYPNATNILLVAEHSSYGNDFNILIPSSNGYSERSWALRGFGSYNFSFIIDGVNVFGSAAWTGDAMGHGYLDASQLMADLTHTVTVNSMGGNGGAYGVLVIVYRVP